MKISELPKGSIVELHGEVYELTADWHSTDGSDVLTQEEMGTHPDAKIISVPYEVTLKLAEWLDNVYTKTGNPESLIVEASTEAFKTKDDAHISDRPATRSGWEAREAIEEVLLRTRADADMVMDAMDDIVKTNPAVTVADLYDLVGITSTTFTDNQWGWRAPALSKAVILKVRNGYRIVMPKPESFKEA